MNTKTLHTRIQERTNNLIKEFQRSGFITERSALILKDRVTRDVQELETYLVLDVFTSSSKSSCSVVSTRDAGTVPLFHGKVTD